VNLNIPQLVMLAGNAGFSGTDLVTAVAVALAESGGNPQAYNPERQAGAAQGFGSFGLWQIYLQAHPEFSGSNLFDPQTNASAAFSVYRGAGGTFAPWSTFKSGAYLAHADAVSQAIGPAAPSPAVAVADDGAAVDSGAVDESGIDNSGPTNGGIVGIVAIGGLLFWAAMKIFNG
jgi:Lysozyme like domain